jgi:hypothetical protein
MLKINYLRYSKKIPFQAPEAAKNNQFKAPENSKKVLAYFRPLENHKKVLFKAPETAKKCERFYIFNYVY